MDPVRVLLVEDEPVAAAEVARLLRGQGWQVETCVDGVAGLTQAVAQRFDVIVADRMMPRVDGVSMLAQLRNQFDVVTPAIILSALHEANHRIEGLDAGADDYLAKPFDGLELVARIKALLRRTRFNAHDEVLLIGDLEIFVNTGAVKRGGRALALTKAEFRLLLLLAETAPDVVTHRMILSRVMNWRAEDDPESPLVPVAIRRLRVKIDGEGAGESLIETVRGMGYRLSTGGA
jgi:two-component system OmpR family response regulator